MLLFSFIVALLLLVHIPKCAALVPVFLSVPLFLITLPFCLKGVVYQRPNQAALPASLIRLIISVVIWQEPVDIAGCAVTLNTEALIGTATVFFSPLLRV